MKILENSPPLGNNNQGSKQLFAWRDYYQNSYYPYDDSLDTWYENPLYGVVDFKGNAVRPLIEQIVPVNNDVSVLDFVEAAWNDLYAELQLLIKQRKISAKNSFVSKVKVKEGYKSIQEKEDELLNLLYDTFVRDYLALRPDRLLRTNNQQSFMTELERFIDLYSSIIPISKVSLNFSENYHIQYSGLALDMDLGQDSDDFTKSKIVDDPAFPTFKKLCKKYGFFIDKHAPWRLVADIGAKGLIPYLEAAGTKYEEIFETHFSLPHLEDISALEGAILQLFAKYKGEYPHVRSCGNSNFELEELLLFYHKLRLKESKIELSQAKIRIETDKVLKLYKHRGYISALNYINKNALPVLTRS